MKILRLFIYISIFTFSFTQIEDGCDLPDFNLYLTDSGEVFYNSSADVGGFQFNVDGATIVGGSGGDSADAGFVVSAGGNTVLGFSFTGAVVPAGCGTLVVLDLNGSATGLSGIVMSDSVGGALPFEYYEGGGGNVDTCEDESACNFGAEGDCEYAQENYDCDGNCIVNIDCNGDCGGNAELDECGVCDGAGADVMCDDGSMVCDASDCETGGGDISSGCDLPDFNLYLTDSGEVFYNSSADVGGFQFNVDGATIVGGSGGDSADAGFVVSAGGNTVLGFSFTGAVVPAGCGTLVVLDLSGNASGLSEIIMAGSGGEALPFEYYEGGGGNVDTCEDESACNFGAEADCEYAAYECSNGEIVCSENECPDELAEAVIGFGNMTDQGLEVILSNSVPLAGFQFDISGFSVSSASGGVAESAGFQISNSTSTVLGFSLTGATIPAGDHVLTTLYFEALEESACLENVIL